jgi:hypothetical protein
MPPVPRPATVSGVAPPGLQIPTDVTYADLLAMLARDLGNTDIASVPGLQGERGIQGIQGEQGIQGLQGLKGDKGDQGDPGVDAAIPGPWIGLALEAGFSELAPGSYGPPAYRLEGDIARLRGIITKNSLMATGDIAFISPVEARPARSRAVATAIADSVGGYLFFRDELGGGGVTLNWLGAGPTAPAAQIAFLDGVVYPL